MRNTRRAPGQQPVWRVLVAGAIVIAAVVILATTASHHHAGRAARRAVVSPPVVLVPLPTMTTPVAPTTTTGSTSAPKHPKQSARSRRSRRVVAQDPQDRPGTPAARALATHRALQHVPYRYDDVTIQLTGALKDGKAVLTVTAPTREDAKAGYRRFLARYQDTGRAYQPRYDVKRKTRRA